MALLAFAVPSLAMAGSSPAGSTFGITNLPSNIRWPDVAYDSANGVYLVVAGNGFVQGQFVSAAGAMLGGPFQINATSAYAQAPRVAYSAAANAFLVTWHSSVGNVAIVRGRLIRYGAGFLTGDIDISPGGSYWEMGAAVAASTSSGEFMVAWMGDYGAGNNTYYRLVSSGGVPLGVATRLTAEPDWERDPSVTYNAATNEFLVAYTGWAGSYSYVQVVRIQPGTGTVLGAAIVGTSSAIYIPEIEYNSQTGKSFVTWYSGNPRGMFGRVLGTTGSPEGDVVPVSTAYYAYDANDLAFNPVSGTYLMTTHTTNTPEDAAVEISGDGVPMAGFVATNSGSSGNFNPRVATATNSSMWLLATSRAFTTLAGQFVSGTPNGPPPPPPPPPPNTARVTGLNASLALPAPAGTVVQFTASASGGTGPLQYKFWGHNSNTGWTLLQDYSSANYVTYAPSVGTNNVQVWVRSSGSSADYEDWRAYGQFTITTGAAVLSGLNRPAGALWAGSPITFTASLEPGSSAAEFKFWLYDRQAARWLMARDYAPDASYTWIPDASQAGDWAVQVWARRQGSQANFDSWTGTDFFRIESATPGVQSVFSSTGAYGQPGTPIQWTALGRGGSGPLEYRFWLYNVSLRTWSSPCGGYQGSNVNTCTWVPTAADLGPFMMQVWVRNAGSNASYEGWNNSPEMVVTPITWVGATVSPGNTVRAGSTLTVGASVSGGSSYEYQFWRYKVSTGEWALAQPWSPVSAHVWTPTASPGSLGEFVFQVWVRTAGGGAILERWAGSGTVTVTP